MSKGGESVVGEGWVARGGGSLQAESGLVCTHLSIVIKVLNSNNNGSLIFIPN